MKKFAHEMLEGTSLRINEIAHSLGYSDAYAFTRAYKDYYGSPPSENRNKMEIELI